MNSTFREEQLLSQFQLPLQKLMELNVKTLQSISYMRPDDLLNIKKPEALFEKNMNIFIQNGHMALNYLHDTFAILESHWLKTAHATESFAEETFKKGKSVASKSALKKKTAKSPVKTAAKRMKASTIKSTTAKAPRKMKAKVAAKTDRHSPLDMNISHTAN